MHESASKIELLTRQLLSSSLIVCCCIFLLPAKTEAASIDDDEDSIEIGDTTVIRYKIDNNMKVRGWKLSPEIYVGNTKVNGEWGVGLLVDKGNYVYGLNNRQASFLWRF
jgi:hypothetical protein